ncbi:ALG-2-like protein [Oopsacas minuta]|uniref:ALG-2-like protein n=1 Tax=Oopsacas minuta TaxID=111878 RepID=A0AAV7JXC1_9METZ|nr:ALG-2-like protein [Oopsacas minuta]
MAGGIPNQDFLFRIFQKVDLDKSNAISADELQQALGNGSFTAFNPETIRLMIGMFDRNKKGTINFNEFGALWKYVCDWQETFRSFDKDNSGAIDRDELKQALTTFGSGEAAIRFDDFIQCCVVIQTLTNSFQHYDTNRNGWITINYEQFLTLAISLRQ